MGRSQEFGVGATFKEKDQFGAETVRSAVEAVGSRVGQGGVTGPSLVGRHDHSEATEVTFANIPESHSDLQVAKMAGFGREHHGYDVTRYPDDNKVRARLWKT